MPPVLSSVISCTLSSPLSCPLSCFLSHPFYYNLRCTFFGCTILGWKVYEFRVYLSHYSGVHFLGVHFLGVHFLGLHLSQCTFTRVYISRSVHFSGVHISVYKSRVYTFYWTEKSIFTWTLVIWMTSWSIELAVSGACSASLVSDI